MAIQNHFFVSGAADSKKKVVITRTVLCHHENITHLYHKKVNRTPSQHSRTHHTLEHRYWASDKRWHGGTVIRHDMQNGFPVILYVVCSRTRTAVFSRNDSSLSKSSHLFMFLLCHSNHHRYTCGTVDVLNPNKSENEIRVCIVF